MRPVPTVILFSRKVNNCPSIRGMLDGSVKRTVACSPGVRVHTIMKFSGFDYLLKSFERKI